MIEPPKNCGDCKKIFAEFGIDIMTAPMAEGGVSLFLTAGKLAEILNELEALRAIAKELAASNPFATSDYECFFCGKHEPGREEGCLYEKACLIERAKQMVKA